MLPKNVSRYRLLSISQVDGVCGQNFACRQSYLSTGYKDVARRTLKVEGTYYDMRSKGYKNCMPNLYFPLKTKESFTLQRQW